MRIKFLLLILFLASLFNTDIYIYSKSCKKIDYGKQFGIAAEMSDMKTMKKILRLIKPKDYNKWNFLSVAVDSAPFEIVKDLIKNPEVDINIDKGYPMTIAILHRGPQMVELLLSHPKIDLSIKNSSGLDALAFAKFVAGNKPKDHDDWKCVKLIEEALKKRENKSKEINYSKEFHDASENYDAKTMKEIIKKTKPKDQSKWGFLSSAVANGQGEVVKELLKNPEIDINEDKGNPILQALLHTGPKMVELLLSYPEMDLSIKICRGLTALEFAKELAADKPKDDDDWKCVRLIEEALQKRKNKSKKSVVFKK